MKGLHVTRGRVVVVVVRASLLIAAINFEIKDSCRQFIDFN